MPLGICMTRAEIMDWVPGSHGSTFSRQSNLPRRRPRHDGHHRARSDGERRHRRRAALRAPRTPGPRSIGPSATSAAAASCSPSKCRRPPLAQTRRRSPRPHRRSRLPARPSAARLRRKHHPPLPSAHRHPAGDRRRPRHPRGMHRHCYQVARPLSCSPSLLGNPRL